MALLLLLEEEGEASAASVGHRSPLQDEDSDVGKGMAQINHSLPDTARPLSTYLDRFDGKARTMVSMTLALAIRFHTLCGIVSTLVQLQFQMHFTQPAQLVQMDTHKPLPPVSLDPSTTLTTAQQE